MASTTSFRGSPICRLSRFTRKTTSRRKSSKVEEGEQGQVLPHKMVKKLDRVETVVPAREPKEAERLEKGPHEPFSSPVP